MGNDKSNIVEGDAVSPYELLASLILKSLNETKSSHLATLVCPICYGRVTCGDIDYQWILTN